MRRAGLSGAMRVRILAAPTPPDKTRRALSSRSSRRPAFGFSPGPWHEKHRSERIGRISREKSTGGAASSGRPISPQKSNVGKRIQANHSASPKCNTGTVKPVFALALLATVGAARAATVDPLLQDFRIALRMGPDQVLIIGGQVQKGLEPGAATFDEAFPVDKTLSRNLSGIIPFDEIRSATPEQLAELQLDRETPWRFGDRWMLHTEGTRPIPLALEKIGIISCCGIVGWVVAVARFESPDKARLVAGLRTEGYLATPRTISMSISTTPMVPLTRGSLYEGAADLILSTTDRLFPRLVHANGTSAGTPYSISMEASRTTRFCVCTGMVV